MGERLVVVLGASGRVGQELIPLLTPRCGVLAVSRTIPATRAFGQERWLNVDLASRDAVSVLFRELRSISSGSTDVILVDLVLDRTSVAAMRRSVIASTRLAAESIERVRALGWTCGVVLASTTAVLAGGLYQTPYGRAKHDQLTSYSNLPAARFAYLLPQLVTGQHARSGGVTWTFRQAADGLADGVLRVLGEGAAQLRLVCPEPNAPRSFASRKWLPDLWRIAPAYAAAWTVRRDRPEAHRAASHTLLRLTPTALSRRVDHHVIPPSRLRRLASRLDARLTLVDMGRASTTGPS